MKTYEYNQHKLSWALFYLKMEMSIIPIVRGEKKPPKGFSWKEFQSRRARNDEVKGWYATTDQMLDIGIVTGEISNITVIDIDSQEGMEIFKGKEISAPCVKTGKGTHMYFRYTDAPALKNKARVLDGIDIRNDGGYVVAPPSFHVEGNREYQWDPNIAPETLTNLEPVPAWFINEIKKACVDNSGMSIEDRISALENAGKGARNETLFNLLTDINREGAKSAITDNQSKEYFTSAERAALSAGLPKGEVDATVKSVMDFWEGRTINQNSPQLVAADRVIIERPNIRWYERGWMEYRGGIWLPIPDQQIKQYVIKHLRSVNHNNITSVKARSIVDLIQCDPAVLVHADRFDQNSDIIVFEDGTYDIGPNVIREHRMDDYCTMKVNYVYDPNARCPLWIEFIKGRFDEDTRKFIQEYIGYCITCDTRHELAVWLLGDPGSGKSTFIHGVKSALSDRVGTLGVANLSGNNGTTSIVGKTLLTAEEQPADYIKQTHTLNSIISGESVRVEYKYKDAFEYNSKSKILWSMNELPKIKSATNGLFRRVHIVKFAPIPTEIIDRNLKEKIYLERAGIMNWALEGLKRLRERGKFEIPASVLDNTEEFKSDSDITAAFVEECCVRDPNDNTPVDELYKNYKNWCEESGQRYHSKRSMSSEWKRMGFTPGRNGSVRYYKGVRIIKICNGHRQY